MASDSVRKNDIVADNEQSFLDLIENLPDGVAVTDEDGKHIFVNSRFAEITGCTNEIITKHGVLEEGLAFIQKPFTIHALASKIREALGQRGDR
ncbi:MAG: PAS domain S-box protein [Candidatus Sabulitectum sp.]|nr:PAS domain S-box protein [Candidatus Sabulitectum sp.]